MNPQLGLPQLYHDQMNIIGKHLWEIQNDAAWSEQVDNAIPILESQSKNACVLTKEDRKSLIQAGFPVRIQAVKTQKKLTRRFLKKQTDWSDWQQSEWSSSMRIATKICLKILNQSLVASISLASFGVT